MATRDCIATFSSLGAWFIVNAPELATCMIFLKLRRAIKNAQFRARFAANPEKYRVKARERFKDPAKRIKKRIHDRRYRSENASDISRRRKMSYAENPAPSLARAKAVYSGRRKQILDGLRDKYRSDPIFNESVRKKVTDWRKANPEKHLMYCRKSRGYPDPTRPIPGVCDNCGKPPGKKPLSLDHCHTTGVFRGWLCGPCNMGLGCLGDDEASLIRALEYLRRSKQ
jgi:hypothetical protein